DLHLMIQDTQVKMIDIQVRTTDFLVNKNKVTLSKDLHQVETLMSPQTKRETIIITIITATIRLNKGIIDNS
ncbi:hypothetical protein B9K03_12160, partial [Rothia sp. Olga]